MRSSFRAVVGGVGAFATALGLLSVATPSVVAETEPLATLVGVASGVEPRTVFVLGTVAVGLSVARAVWRSPDARSVGDDRATERFERVLETPPEVPTAADRTLTANAFEATTERAVDGDDRAMDDVRDRLGGLAVARLRRGTAEPSRAERLVATGEWTDDRTAAAFLSADEGPVAPFRSRLRLWLDPETERRRRVRRTVAAIDALPDPVAPAGESRSGGVVGVEERAVEPNDEESTESGGAAR